ncbi:MAG TPA: radical SAM family heme chaperone HemW [Candidatus Corynebacterium gallistercoris]|uniref:Heme chaperone HemW n=1 Tax=Candidatus Corynebacterium gallistercoris TaxID=2838530 RepID=A0A9D1RXE7_9CORY|nr:radical SAM family heme chaperone HemW [Candidatus Corynebacterium gallistercoris]
MAHGLYIHVPFCSTRCGYCDFNTYTPQELAAAGGAARGNTIEGYLEALDKELELAAAAWDRGHAVGGLDTVFFGGGTPSLLGHEGLNRALRAVKKNFGLAAHAEVTTESNPESTCPDYFEKLREGGFTRISLGMQSAAGHVLKVLERQHTPGRPVEAVLEAHQAGFEHVNLDLIYGTPTETDDDLRRSLDAVLGAGVDHVSAYSLIVEDGTAMARKVRRGELPAPDEDVLADRYQMIDGTLREAGFAWYEVSNWAKPGGECEHNLLYWRSGQWWGAGPGAHGCVQLTPEASSETSSQASAPQASSGLTRTVNAKRPATYYESVMNTATGLPGSVITTENLSRQDVATERIMLGMRLAEGLELHEVMTPSMEQVLEKYQSMGLLRADADPQHTDPHHPAGTRVTLTDQGRYLADGIITDMILAMDEGR